MHLLFRKRVCEMGAFPLNKLKRHATFLEVPMSKETDRQMEGRMDSLLSTSRHIAAWIACQVPAWHTRANPGRQWGCPGVTALCQPNRYYQGQLRKTEPNADFRLNFRSWKRTTHLIWHRLKILHTKLGKCKKKPQNRTHFKSLFREQDNANKIWVPGNSQRTKSGLASSFHHYILLLLCLIILSLRLMILFLYIPAHIHTEGGEGRVWRESWWACRSWQQWHGSTTTGISQHQSQLCRAMAFWGCTDFASP